MERTGEISIKLRTYIKVRDLCETTVLVDLNLPRGVRSTVAHLLCGILPLEVEVGRYAKEKVKPEDRKCKLCKVPVTEDETHFIICCDRFKGIQDDILKPLLESNPETSYMSNIEKLSWLVSRSTLPQSAAIIDTMVKERQNISYKSKGPQWSTFSVTQLYQGPINPLGGLSDSPWTGRQSMGGGGVYTWLNK